jgi:hypothetical protein
MSDSLKDSHASPLKKPLSPMNGPAGSKIAPPSTEHSPATGEPTKSPTPAGDGPIKKPLSPAKLAANRANAPKSTGPTTAAGKATSSENALKSGVYAQKWLAVTGDEQHMANHLLGELRQQFPAQDLLDELMHEGVVQAYMQRWRFIQAYGGMMDARRGQIERGIALDGGDSDSFAEIEERQHIITTALDQLKRVGRITSATLTKLQVVFESSEPAAALIAELRRITAEAAQPEAAVDIAQAQRLAEGLAKDLADTKAELRARIAKQKDAAYRQAALPSDAEAKKFLRYERDTGRRLQRAADAITRRFGRAPVLQRPERKAA